MGWLLRGRVARARSASDGVLDFVVLAFAAWTLVYGACLLAHRSTTWALVAGGIALMPCAWFALRAPSVPSAQPRDGSPPPRSWLRGVNVAAGMAAAVIAAVAAQAWAPVWIFWLIAAGAALAWTARAGDRRTSADRSGALTAAAWAVALAVASMLVVDPDADDTYYVRQATWIAEHGRFPVRDTLFSDERFEAIFFPPWSSLEALAGTVARAAGTSAPGILYLGVTPLATALAVLALWRLLRAWAAPMPAVALSTALVFLLVAACDSQRTVGAFFITRIWQGKAVFVAVLIPVLFTLLHDHAERPTRRTLVLLAAAGVAAVGLTSTAIFVVPVLAAGCMAPLALRTPARAAAGFAATVAYPVSAGVVSLAIGARNPDFTQDEQMIAGALARESVGTGAVALVIVAAALVGPALLRRASAGQMTAGVVLLVGALLSPGVPAIVHDLTGVGEALWRLVWAVPVAALLGAAATGLVPLERPAVVRALPAAAICAALLAWGASVGPPPGMTVASTPAWKRHPRDLADARQIVARARAGHLVLAPKPVSQTILVVAADVTTVSPRDFYVRGLGRMPGHRDAARASLRLRLQEFADSAARSPAFVIGALRVLDVDIACVRRGSPNHVRVLRRAGYADRFSTPGLVCMHDRS